MNIKSAKQEIKNTIRAYLLKDELGSYYITKEKQRPIFLMGAPGIGKTAIMKQIATELKVNLLSYSLTHHTRQSAIGLPSIEEKKYSGTTYTITEYTMSEIIAAIYECMEKTGVKEGILFLDEINCISETLTPIMLQFLQYKTFGKHAIPDGWVLITAGNPPEYNNSVREFDIATLDRLKYIEVEPDYDTWKEYAYENGIHSSIMTYLESKKLHFYIIESTVDGVNFVTARGWEDLSMIMKIYEKLKITIDENLIKQYVQDENIAFHFSAFYSLYCRYKTNYDIPAIVSGKLSREQITTLKDANLEERFSLIGMFMEYFSNEIQGLKDLDGYLGRVYQILTSKKMYLETSNNSERERVIEQCIEELRREQKQLEDLQQLQANEKLLIRKTVETLEYYKQSGFDFGAIKRDFEDKASEKKESIHDIKSKLEHVFLFMEDAFGNNQEMFLFTTNFTVNSLFTWFVSKYGCEKYYEYNKELLLYERENRILLKLQEITA